jgi:hypothetical protein
MNFIQAIEALQEGKLVYRKSYEFNHWWSSNAGDDWARDLLIFYFNGEYELDTEVFDAGDYLATDWEIKEEIKK